jgi:GntR family transcriptional regulator
MSVGRLAAEALISPAPDPLYLQVYGAITDAIRSGRLQPGDRLPTERQFSEQLGVSRATVRRALKRLVDEGLVEASVGRGSFVCAGPMAEPANALMSFTELAAAGGHTASARVLSQRVRPAVPEEASVFGIGVQALVFELRRLRMLDSRPVALDRTRIPLTLAPALADQDFADASIYATLEAAGAAPVTADMVASATTADDADAAVLGVDAGTPLLVCSTMSFDAEGRLVEIGEIMYRADRYQVHVTLVRQGERVAARMDAPR